jgi:hypothetical protein
LQAQQAALAEGRADRDAPAQPLLSTEGLLLAARLVEDVAFSFATLIPEQQVVNLLTLAARIEAELTELDSLDIITT